MQPVNAEMACNKELQIFGIGIGVGWETTELRSTWAGYCDNGKSSEIISAENSIKRTLTKKGQTRQESAVAHGRNGPIKMVLCDDASALRQLYDSTIRYLEETIWHMTNRR